MKAKLDTTYAHIVDGRVQWVFTSVDLPEWNPDHLTVVEIPEGGVVGVGDSYEAGVFIPKIDDKMAELARIMRMKRDEVLSASDWTQLADIPAATRTAWQPYRQALRDVPDQPGFPTTITWPMIPSSL